MKQYNDYDSDRGESQASQIPKFISKVILEISKRLWIVLLTIVLAMTPLTVTLLRQPQMHLSFSKVMVSTLGTSGAFGAPSVMSEMRARSDFLTMQYYEQILISANYKQMVAGKLVRLYPDMAVGDLGELTYRTTARQEGFITILAESLTPERAKILCVVGTEIFEELCVSFERVGSERVESFVADQIGLMSAKIEATEEELQTFLRDRDLVLENDKSGVGDELRVLEKRNTDVQRNIALTEINIESLDQTISSVVDNLNTGLSTDNSDEIEKIKANLEERRKGQRESNEAGGGVTKVERAGGRVSGDSSEYAMGRNLTVYRPGADLSPIQLKRQLTEEVTKLSALKNEAEFLNQEILVFKSTHPDLPKDILEYFRLTRTKEVLENTLNILINRREEARIRIASAQGGVKIIDYASEPKPVRRGRTQKMAIGALMTLIFSVILVMVIGSYDNRILDIQSISHLGKEILGTIPIMGKDGEQKKKKHDEQKKRDEQKTKQSKVERRSRGKIVTHNEKTLAAEVFRSIRIILQFIARDKNKKVFILSSPNAQEGKSINTANIGATFAYVGKKTLIIDLDLRRASQHEYFETEKKPGISDYLIDGVPLEQVITETFIPGLYLIPVGKHISNPAELIASNAMRELVLKVRDMFDVVLIDSPPILVCSDPLSAAEYTDGMILVCRMEQTKIPSMEFAIDAAERLNIEIVGIIINHTSQRFGKSYYYLSYKYTNYGYYYGYHYSSHYYDVNDQQIADEEKAESKKSA